MEEGEASEGSDTKRIEYYTPEAPNPGGLLPWIQMESLNNKNKKKRKVHPVITAFRALYFGKICGTVPTPYYFLNKNRFMDYWISFDWKEMDLTKIDGFIFKEGLASGVVDIFLTGGFRIFNSINEVRMVIVSHTWIQFVLRIYRNIIKIKTQKYIL